MRTSRLRMTLLLFLLFLPAGQATPAYAQPALPVQPSCNTEPSNTDCNGQFTPGGCSNDEYYQASWAYSIAPGGAVLGDVNMAYSNHCGSNWANGTTWVNDALCWNLIQRASGPDGGRLSIWSPVFGPVDYDNYEGVLVYARREYAHAAIACMYPGDGDIVHQSPWTPWFFMQP